MSVQEIEEISALADPVLRNLRITQAYHELTMAMAKLLGQENASWCAFGTWASRTAGLSIRGESTPAIVRTALAFAQRVPPRFRPIGASVDKVVQQVSENVARGNLLVFQDLGPLFVHLIETLGGPHPDDLLAARAAGAATGADSAAAAVDRCVASLRAGPAEEGGQDLLISAVRSYGRAFLAHQPGERAEHVLLANLYVGLHEQIRLQQPIAQALSWPAGTRLAPLPLRRQVQRSWENMVTRQLMELRLPAADFSVTRRLVSQRIGSDIGKARGGARFPAALTHLQNIELKALLYDIDRTPNTLLGSAADNWVNLGDRMNFVADLFRARQQEGRLFQPPFTAQQVAVIKGGRIPDNSPLG
ncbi:MULTISPECIES: hypothetical protein [unclassified Streptomyces]|uniref:hypothetical protein n=1 Tax=unclassified Streptomyces TaxID=2593676 RepID=UPI0036F8CBE9